MKHLILVFTAVTCGALGAAGQEALASDRPGIGSGAAVLTAGTVQVEAGLDVDRGRSSSITTFSFPEALLRIGLTRLELEIFLNSYSVTHRRAADVAPSEDGFQDLGVGLKVPVYGGEGRVQLAAQGILSAPTGSDAFTNHEWVPTVNLLADLSLSARHAVSFNAGYQAGPGAVAEGVTLFVTPSAVLRSGTGVYAGWAGFFNQGEDQHFVEGGFVFPEGADAQLDLNGGWDLVSDDFFVGFGFTVRRRR